MSKRKFIAEDGVEVTDQMIEDWAAPWEAGEVSGKADGLVSAPGRPRLSDYETKIIAFRLPVPMIEAIDRKAAQNGETRSQRIRKALLNDLMDS